MSKRVFGVCDPDGIYARRLSNYIWKKEGGTFEVRAFTEPESLEEFLADGFLDAALITESFAQQLDRDISDTIFAEAAAAILTENREPLQDRPSIYRYQSADRILDEIMAAYRRRAGEQPEDGLSARIYGVYSPIRHCFKSSLSIALTQVLSEKGRSLLLNFEDLCGHRMLVCGPDRIGLSDLLYSYLTDGSVDRLTEAAESTAEGDYLPAAVRPEDVRQTEPDVFRQVISRIAEEAGYRYIVVDLGDALTDPLPGMKACDRIFVPVLDDEISATKLEVWQMWLRQRGVRDIQRKLTTVSFSDEVYSPELMRRKAGELLGAEGVYAEG